MGDIALFRYIPPVYRRGGKPVRYGEQKQRRESNEQSRQLTLQRVQQWLNDHGASYDITQVIIFGSLIRPGQFHENSDVDLAIHKISPNYHFLVMGLLSAELGREVDLIELTQCPFQQRIQETGLAWTAMPD